MIPKRVGRKYSVYSASMPSTNVGKLMPTSANACPSRSRTLPGHLAEARPIGMPIASQTTTPPNTSDIVTGMRDITSSATGRLERYEYPRSPCSRLPRKIRYCSQIGLSSPRFTRICAISSSVALSPAMMRAGSDGVT